MEKVIIESNKEFKSYAALCAYLGDKPQGGGMKIVHLEHFLDYFTYEKVKGTNKIVIKDVIKRNYVRFADREVDRNCKWNKDIGMQILAELEANFSMSNTLAPQVLPYKLQKMVIYSKDLYNLVGLCNGKFHSLRDPANANFHKIVKDYADATGKAIDDKLNKEVYNWFSDTSNAFYRIVEDVLAALAKKNAIIYTKTFVITMGDAPEVLRLASSDEDKEIRLTKLDILREFGVDATERSLLRSGLGQAFYNKVNVSLKERFNIIRCYSVYEIAWTTQSLKRLEDFKCSLEERLRAKLETNKKSYNRETSHKYLRDLLIPVSM